MEASKMIRIGDFSKLGRVSIKALRLYDEMGLLKPVEVDPFTSYRYYDFEQLARLNRILALKDLGFSLEEIGQFLDGNLTSEQVRGMLKLRQAEIRQRVKEETERLVRVEARLRQIEQENNMSEYDVVIRKIDPIRVASIRDIVPTPPDQGMLWDELGGYFANQHIHPDDSPCLTLYYDEEYKERDWDLEVCMPFNGALQESQRVKVRTLPPVEAMACTIHQGSFITLNDAYQAIGRWIDANGYRICGPAREVYLREARTTGSGVSQVDPETVTEIQFPVERV
jgi:DNA-binding transcriptional MerR regulator